MMDNLSAAQLSRIVESFVRGAQALKDLAFEARRANDIKERMGR